METIQSRPISVETVPAFSSITHIPIGINQITFTFVRQSKDQPEYKNPELIWLREDPRVLHAWRDEQGPVIVRFKEPYLMPFKDIVNFVNHRLAEGDEVSFEITKDDAPKSLELGENTKRVKQLVSEAVKNALQP